MKTTLKKTLSMFLALIMILSAMIVPAWADASSSVTVKLVGKDGGTI